ncbi:hypothetical protein ACVWZX_003082 [Deinococcus sp. UYEF24]
MMQAGMLTTKMTLSPEALPFSSHAVCVDFQGVATVEV